MTLEAKDAFLASSEKGGTEDGEATMLQNSDSHLLSGMPTSAPTLASGLPDGEPYADPASVQERNACVGIGSREAENLDQRAKSRVTRKA